ncbi:hypothetical protein V6N13_109131 [Hibiscus sabdariffa]|uniref:Alcohol dehydrogenase N-terminal domain-containing protein n=1 Tax=Hibiscus sabdariffa TaxID=183260 RepID=A0ABR2FNQ1_9ROSI
MEAVGEVIAAGPGLTGWKVGDIVAYAGNPMGAYAKEQILPAEKVESRNIWISCAAFVKASLLSVLTWDCVC